jgi:hexosaminidase
MTSPERRGPQQPVLLPAPRRLEWHGEALATARVKQIRLRGDDRMLFGVARHLAAAVLEEHDLRWQLSAADAGGEPAVALELGTPNAPSQREGYRLRIDGAGVVVTGADAAGLFYGCQTLRQILRQGPELLPGCTVEDHPDYAARGVMLDISRDKVPTNETLYRLVDRLAEWKVNQLELYTEHTFAYRDHREVWAQASPMTHDDVLRLDAYCRDRFVELVPNQNSFGHLHRWLGLPAYRHLAEAPDGWIGPDGTPREVPFSLNPTDGASLRFLDGLYAELLPHFTSRKFNVGGDETWDLGQGASRAACERKGKGRVYLDFLLALHDLVTRHGRTMHVWGDIIIQYPELVGELPDDVTVLEWGYEADHPFAEHTATIAATGLPFYVCPGTSSWNSIAGRTTNCLANIESAARNGLARGATGFLVTDWGDNGHWHHPPASYLGLAAGAALAWCYESNRDLDIATVLDRHVVRDRAGVAGGILVEAGKLHEHLERPMHNATILYRTLRTKPDPAEFLAGVDARGFRSALAATQALLERVTEIRPSRPDAELLTRELTNALQLLAHACRKGTFIVEGSGDAASLATELRGILGEYRELWSERNRIGGLHDSARRLEEVIREYGAARA